MQIIKATGLHRKFGGATWRDPRFSGPFLEMFFSQSVDRRGPTKKKRMARTNVEWVAQAQSETWATHSKS